MRSLKSLDVIKGSSLDGISPKLLRFCADGVTEPVTQLLNSPLCAMVYSQQYENKRVSHRSPGPNRPAGLKTTDRPIAVTPVLSKCMERLLTKAFLPPPPS